VVLRVPLREFAREILNVDSFVDLGNRFEETGTDYVDQALRTPMRQRLDHAG
jgi:hypothetical protein